MSTKKKFTIISIFMILILSLSSYSSTTVATWYFEINEQFSFKKTVNTSINSRQDNSLSHFTTAFQKNSSFLPVFLLEEISELEKTNSFDFNISSTPQDDSPVRGDIIINNQAVLDNVSSLIIIPSSLVEFDYYSVATISLYFSSFFEGLNWSHNLEVYSKDYHFETGGIGVIETILNFQSFEEDGNIWQGFFKWEYAYSGETYWMSTKIWQTAASKNITYANSDPEYDETAMNAFFHYSFTSKTAQDIMDDFKKFQNIFWIIILTVIIGGIIITLIYQTFKK